MALAPLPPTLGMIRETIAAGERGDGTPYVIQRWAFPADLAPLAHPDPDTLADMVADREREITDAREAFWQSLRDRAAASLPSETDPDRVDTAAMVLALIIEQTGNLDALADALAGMGYKGAEITAALEAFADRDTDNELPDVSLYRVPTEDDAASLRRRDPRKVTTVQGHTVYEIETQMLPAWADTEPGYATVPVKMGSEVRAWRERGSTGRRASKRTPRHHVTRNGWDARFCTNDLRATMGDSVNAPDARPVEYGPATRTVVQVRRTADGKREVTLSPTHQETIILPTFAGGTFTVSLVRYPNRGSMRGTGTDRHPWAIGHDGTRWTLKVDSPDTDAARKRASRAKIAKGRTVAAPIPVRSVVGTPADKRYRQALSTATPGAPVDIAWSDGTHTVRLKGTGGDRQAKVTITVKGADSTTAKRATRALPIGRVHAAVANVTGARFKMA